MATHIKQIISDFLEIKKREFLVQKKIEQVTKKFFDKTIQSQIKLKRITDDTVILGSDSSGLAYIVNLKKEQLLKEIQKNSPQINKIQIECS